MRKPLQTIGKIAFWMVWPALLVYLRLGMRTRLLIICDGEFLVLKGWLGTGNWSLPGGGLHRNEDPMTGLMREVQEETGIRPTVESIKPAYSGVSQQYGLKFRYICYVLELPKKPTVKIQRHEIADYAWQSTTNPTLPMSQDCQQALAWWNNKK